MRPLLLALLLAACGSEEPVVPVSKPDAGADAPATLDVPCGGACGAGTVCVGGRCEVVATDAGAADVPAEDRGIAADVCVSQTAGNCCGVACVVPTNAAVAACRAGACAVGGCNAGFADCDSNVANGCEVIVGTDSAHCGACGALCAAGRRCFRGACVVPPTCAPDTGDCDGDPANGCEAMLCGGVCRDFQRDPDNCGGCGVWCFGSPATHALNPCVAGRCTRLCEDGWGDCDGSALNGCETEVRTTTHCGRCGVRCARGCGATDGGFTCL